MTTERFLTTGEVAKICKVTIPAVRKWCLKQGLEYTSVGAGKAIRIRLEDLRTFWEFKHGDIPESLQRVLDGGQLVRMVFWNIFSVLKLENRPRLWTLDDYPSEGLFQKRDFLLFFGIF